MVNQKQRVYGSYTFEGQLNKVLAYECSHILMVTVEWSGIWSGQGLNLKFFSSISKFGCDFIFDKDSEI